MIGRDLELPSGFSQHILDIYPRRFVKYQQSLIISKSYVGKDHLIGVLMFKNAVFFGDISLPKKIGKFCHTKKSQKKTRTEISYLQAFSPDVGGSNGRVGTKTGDVFSTRVLGRVVKLAQRKE